ncbi:uncharacterized protein LOC115626414 [Scaptodrosophila lebanonensis]|uniref:Uncharacterized protein LOC115626414 n=1 Tax=Drosophila lebanonensis TaxID=7225 RepID=A0A6J2TM50_DROLE|nr:uncharacterized protein LOC115626414 [Scaptodrosophila lebanonensis]
MDIKLNTPQQLAYLDELKQRLRELRARQESFIQQTAEMMRGIEANASGVNVRARSTQPIDVRELERMGNIKLLIQRFEDLRKTSRQFNELPTPEELIGVDVQKLLKGYEQLIDENKMLQCSLLLLKMSGESCSHVGEAQTEDEEEATRQEEMLKEQMLMMGLPPIQEEVSPKPTQTTIRSPDETEVTQCVSINDIPQVERMSSLEDVSQLSLQMWLPLDQNQTNVASAAELNHFEEISLNQYEDQSLYQLNIFEEPQQAEATELHSNSSSKSNSSCGTLESSEGAGIPIVKNEDSEKDLVACKTLSSTSGQIKAATSNKYDDEQVDWSCSKPDYGMAFA